MQGVLQFDFILKTFSSYVNAWKQICNQKSFLLSISFFKICIRMIENSMFVLLWSVFPSENQRESVGSVQRSDMKIFWCYFCFWWYFSPFSIKSTYKVQCYITKMKWNQSCDIFMYSKMSFELMQIDYNMIDYFFKNMYWNSHAMRRKGIDKYFHCE